ncbi:hypothetical protein BC827DRAFT_1228632 [Russula dissimulans]|nr:hypothetical protein BC827DRAFT_1228632 [Russula dissimulans]
MAHSFSLVIDDASPLLSYFPFADTLSIPNFFAGWNPCFTTSACPTFPGQQGNGTSFHVTSLDGAAFSIQWWGNGIQLFGFAQGPLTYDLQLDGLTNSSIPVPASGTTLLATYHDLQPANHTLSLIVHNPTNSSSALIGIDQASITINSTSPNVTFFNTVTEDTSLPFTGHWSFVNDSSLSSEDISYHTTSSAGDFLRFNFSGTAVQVLGFRDATSGRFSVQLDNDSVTLNGESSSREATTLFFRTGLNNSIPHTLTITNAEDRLLAIGLVNVTTASSPSVTSRAGSSSHISGGTIAAIVVASILGTLVFLIAAFFLWRRRRQFGRILHRKRLFVAPNGNDHSKVLDIVRGPEDDDLDDMYEDKAPAEKRSRHGTNNGSGSLSFTLDLPIQSRPSLPPSQRDYSGNSAQDIPRSPTISLGRTGTHARGSSRGVPLHDISFGDGVDSGSSPQSPSSVAQGQATSEGVRTSVLQEMVENPEGRTFELTPILPAPPLPRTSVAVTGPAQGGSDQSQPSYSFLDISGSSQVSFASASVRHPGFGASESSSSSGSMRRRSDEPFSSTRRISLPFAMGFHRDPSLLATSRDRGDLPSPPSTSVEFPRFSLNIRPLPRIPQTAVTRGTESSLIRPTPPRRTFRPHAQSTPPLHVEVGFNEPQQIPRSVSVTTAPPTSALSSGAHVPHIIIHPSSLLRAHPRTSSVVSPTESVPVTVSDIHFRHSSDDERPEPESRRTSAQVGMGGQSPPSTPPQPQRSYASPFIMHKLFGTPAPPPRPPGGQFLLQSPGAGPSRLRDRDPSPEDTSSGEQEK